MDKGIQAGTDIMVLAPDTQIQEVVAVVVLIMLAEQVAEVVVEAEVDFQMV